MDRVVLHEGMDKAYHGRWDSKRRHTRESAMHELQFNRTVAYRIESFVAWFVFGLLCFQGVCGYGQTQPTPSPPAAAIPGAPKAASADPSDVSKQDEDEGATSQESASDESKPDESASEETRSEESVAKEGKKKTTKGDDAEKATGDDAKSTAEAEAEAAKQNQKKQDAWLQTEISKKITKFTCDRVPSAALKSWATPPTSNDDEADQEGSEGEGSTSEPGDHGPGERANGPSNGTAGAEGPPVPDEPTKAKLKAFEEMLASLQRNIRLGEWDEVKTKLAGLDAKESKPLYLQILSKLAGQPTANLNVRGLPPSEAAMIQMAMRQQSNGGKANAEVNLISIPDLIGLIKASPLKEPKEALDGLGRLLKISLAAGNIIDQLKLQLLADSPLLPRRDAAKLLSRAGKDELLGEFLPDVPEAIKENDREALNLLSRYYMAKNAQEPSAALLEQAWYVTQAVLATGEVSREEKQEAMRRAVELVPQIKEELGAAWMSECFGERPQQGKEIMAALGEELGNSLQRYQHASEARDRLLVLQRTAVNSLFKEVKTEEEIAPWRQALNLLAQNWMREALVSKRFDRSTSYGSRMRFDAYGNVYYIDDEMMFGNHRNHDREQPSPIPTADVLKTRPTGPWREVLEPGIAAKFDMTYAQLFLKVNEPEEAFPYIESLAEELPEQAKDLIEEFLRVWAKNHSPNTKQDQTGYYMFSFGFSRRAERIPLTRSKQNRNLQELADWAKRLKQLPIEDWDEDLLVEAFSTSHSDAEVYRLSDIESVFGSIDNLQPKTLATFAQKMRSNLAELWRSPKVQKDNSTNRKQKDIQLEVQRGYATAVSVVEMGRQKYPDDWQLQLAEACIEYDQNAYANELKKSSKYAGNRKAALAKFKKAAQAYAAVAEELPEDEQTVEVYQDWLYACLGAPDVERIDEKSVPLPNQVDEVAKALNGLPKHIVEHHQSLFANSLFQRLSAVNPACKFRYLREGFKIVGDHEQAHEAKKVFDYYKDLVTELKLQSKIDGSADVGQAPFGLFVDLVHTTALERESGGFSRYLQNQNTGYYYNYGRPTEDYRDKFEEASIAALEENFEVLSVTFQKPNVNSKAVAEEGWRVTPYAYLLLKARGPEVDNVPSLRLDLDFLDTSGYAVLPVESPILPVAANRLDPNPTLPANLEITQTLDERQASDGRLVLEVKATGTGLIPAMDQLVSFSPKGFEVVDVDDDGVAVTEFDSESDQTAVKTERLWVLTMQSDVSQPAPKTFAFAEVKMEGAKSIMQHFVDADIEEVPGPTIQLERRYPRSTWPRIMALLATAAAICLGGIAWMVMQRSAESKAAPDFHMPEKVTPFTTINLLEQIRTTNGLQSEEKTRLGKTIGRLQDYYFDDESASEGDEPDLQSLIQEWIGRFDRGTESTALRPLPGQPK